VFSLLSAEEDNDYMKWYTILSVFDTLVLWGKMTILGYPGTTFLDSLPVVPSGQPFVACTGYYGYTSDVAQCASYINYLQFLAFILILIQPIQALFGYMLWKGKGTNAEVKVPGRYDAIGERTSET